MEIETEKQPEAPPWRSKLVELIRADFERIKSRNPKYSVRAYANQIGLSKSTLSGLLLGTLDWQVSAGRAVETLLRLKKPTHEGNAILMELGQLPRLEIESLAPKDHELLLDPRFFPVLFAHDLPKEKRSTTAVAHLLGLDEDEVATITERLVRDGLLIQAEDGSLTRKKTVVRASDGVTSEHVKRHHEGNLAHAKNALRTIPVEDRDFTSMTFVGSTKKLEALRAEIRACLQRAVALADQEEENDEVFRLSVQLFPLRFDQ